MKVGGYEVLGELGRGGMGVVYRVRGPDGREAALKLLVKAEGFARFERERRLLASLGEAQGFVPLLDAGSSGEGAWLVMPFVPGGTLRQRLRPGALGVEETIALGVELAQALGRAHEHGIVHRDVKPENVLFTASGRPLLGDLGLSKHFDRSVRGGSQSGALTEQGTLAGTAGYVPHEQLMDAASAGPPSDVFALGAVLYECLAGRPAFEGANVVEVLAKVSAGSVEPIGRRDVPSWLEAVIRRSLELDPVRRFADGAALARALSARGASAAKTGKGRRSLVPLVLGAGVGGVALVVALALRGGQAAKVEARPPRQSEHVTAPPAVPGKISISAPDLVDRAREKVVTCDFDGAMADAAKAIELDPRLAAAWRCRGAARIGNGDPEGALADYAKTLELAPGLAEVWLERGAARMSMRDWDGAIADDTKAIELDPRLAAAWADRGAARGWKSDWDGEIADETRAIELDPRDLMAWLNRGVARGRKGDWDAAVADETKAIELDPKRATAWSSRGIARCNTSDFKGAIVDLERSLELDPDGADSAAARSYLLQARKRVR